jgi:tRNA A37 threonylcarbamoyltransferase TsaD
MNPVTSAPTHDPILLVHGGAWAIPADAAAAHETGVRSALEAGYDVLALGGSAIDAVEAAVTVLENDPTFDAGRGSFLTSDGRVQLDALLMDGGRMKAGGVACVERLRNPIQAARLVLEKSPHVYFVGEGAERFAAAHGMTLIDNADLVLDRERERLAQAQARHAAGLADETFSGQILRDDKTPETAFRANADANNTPGAPGLDSQTWESTTADSAPSLALVVSGGHTHLYLAQPAQGTWRYTLIGRTVDDAAGEAFDKVAKLLGLGYPGGPWIDALAHFGNPHAVQFSFAQIKTKAHLGGKPARTKAAKTAPIAHLDPRFLFSFSGIKTAVLRYVELHELRVEARARVSRLFPVAPPFSEFAPANAERVGARDRKPAIPETREDALALCPQPTIDLIASFQSAVVGDLLKKTFAAAESLGTGRILITGGVAANRELRARFTQQAAQGGMPIAFPTLALSTDNAAMIAAAAWPRFLAREFAPPDLSADPSLALG